MGIPVLKMSLRHGVHGEITAGQYKASLQYTTAVAAASSSTNVVAAPTAASLAWLRPLCGIASAISCTPSQA